MVHPCATVGCGVLTMGELCVDCERLAVDLAEALAAEVRAIAAGAEAAPADERGD